MSEVVYSTLRCCKVLYGILSVVATVCAYSTVNIAENCAEVVEPALCATG